MNDKVKTLLSDQEVFDLFELSKKQYEKYLEVNSFEQFSVFEQQQKNQFFQTNFSLDKPLDLCFSKERNDAIME